ncbi:MAG: hypothetical protein R6U32_02745 [Candidatus Woesearchaeota archaeon]
MFEFKDFITILPDTWQARTVTRVGRHLRNDIKKDSELNQKLKEAEDKGSIEKVEDLIQKAAKEEMKEIKEIMKVGNKAEIMENHEVERLGEINKGLERIKDKAGKEKVEELMNSVNAMIKKIEDLEKLQMAKFDKLSNDSEVWTRVWNWDRGSVSNELISIGRVERRLTKKAKRLEKRIRKIEDKISKEKKSKKIDSELKKLKKEIDKLGPVIDEEIKYFSTEVKDEILFFTFLRRRIRNIEEKVKGYIKQGFPEDIADKLNTKVEGVMRDEIENIMRLVKDYRFAISRAERQYGKTR